MGNCGTENEEEINEAMNKLKEKSPEIINEAVLKKEVIDLSKEKLLKKRNEDLENAKTNNISSEDVKKMLKEYNLKELEIENDYFKNELDKIHNFYELGLDLSNPAKESAIKQIKKPVFQNVVYQELYHV